MGETVMCVVQPADVSQHPVLREDRLARVGPTLAAGVDRRASTAAPLCVARAGSVGCLSAHAST